MSCVGFPAESEGGDLVFCGSPTKPGRRFCDRCHHARVLYLIHRIEQLQAQVTSEIMTLSQLVNEKR